MLRIFVPYALVFALATQAEAAVAKGPKDVSRELTPKEMLFVSNAVGRAGYEVEAEPGCYKAYTDNDGKEMYVVAGQRFGRRLLNYVFVVDKAGKVRISSTASEIGTPCTHMMVADLTNDGRNEFIHSSEDYIRINSSDGETFYGRNLNFDRTKQEEADFFELGDGTFGIIKRIIPPYEYIFPVAVNGNSAIVIAGDSTDEYTASNIPEIMACALKSYSWAMLPGKYVEDVPDQKTKERLYEKSTVELECWKTPFRNTNLSEIGMYWIETMGSYKGKTPDYEASFAHTGTGRKGRSVYLERYKKKSGNMPFSILEIDL